MQAGDNLPPTRTGGAVSHEPHREWVGSAARSLGAVLLLLLAIALNDSCVLPEVSEPAATADAVAQTEAGSSVSPESSAAPTSKPPGVANEPAIQAAASTAGQSASNDVAGRQSAASAGVGGTAEHQTSSASSASASAAMGGASGTAGSAGTKSQPSPTVPSASSGGLRGCSPDAMPDSDGSFVPTHIENTGPDGQSWVYFPQELGKDGARHAALVFAPSSGLGPNSYLMHLNRLASHGFVTITQPTSDDGAAERAAIDWLSAENASAASQFYGKLDLERLAAGGHSKGSLTTFQIASDPRIRLFVLICGGSGSGMTGAMNIQEYTLLLGGADDTAATPNFEADFAALNGPGFFMTKSATGLTDCAKNNLEPWVAFMRWRFCYDTDLSGGFLNFDGKYCTAPWTCKISNRI